MCVCARVCACMPGRYNMCVCARVCVFVRVFVCPRVRLCVYGYKNVIAHA